MVNKTAINSNHNNNSIKDKRNILATHKLQALSERPPFSAASFSEKTP
jgi:hypothetical protein